MKDLRSVLLLTSELEVDYQYIKEASALLDRARQRLDVSLSGAGLNDELDLMVLGACLPSSPTGCWPSVSTNCGGSATCSETSTRPGCILANCG
jgi:hypothetical protein